MSTITEIAKRTSQLNRSPKKERVKEALLHPVTITRELNNRSLYHFFLWAWDAISNQPYVENWHIPYLCAELEKVAYRVGKREKKLYDVLINIPPGTTKTILVSIIFPAWCWTKWYWMRFITVSYSGTLSLESAEYSRDLIKSAQFRDVYPELVLKRDKDTKGNFKITKVIKNATGDKVLLGGNRYSTSVGGTLTGFHGDILIWDDPINPTQAASEKEIESKAHWLSQTLPTRKTNKEVTTIIGIMQRLNEGDPSGVWLKKAAKIKKKKGLKTLKHFCLPGEIKRYKENVRPKKLVKKYVDGLLDKNRMPWNVIEELEDTLGQYGYAGQIGQAPTPAGGGMFKVDNLQYTDIPIDKKEIAVTIRYWDKAGTQGGGAYSAGVKISKLKNGMFYISDVVRGQWSTEKREKRIKQTAIVDGQKVYIGLEQEPGSGGKESAESSIRNLAGFSARKDRPTGDKIFRADPFSVQVNNGNVIILVGKWNEDFVKELELFPNATYKDQVDAASAGFNILTKKKKVKRLT